MEIQSQKSDDLHFATSSSTTPGVNAEPDADGHILLHLLLKPYLLPDILSKTFRLSVRAQDVSGQKINETKPGFFYFFFKEKKKKKNLERSLKLKITLNLRKHINSKMSLNFQQSSNLWESTQTNWSVQSAFQLFCRTAALPKLLVLTAQSPRKHQKTLDTFYEVFCTEFLFHKFSVFLFNFKTFKSSEERDLCVFNFFFPYKFQTTSA